MTAMPALICLGIAVRDLVFRVPVLPTGPQKLTASSLSRRGGGMAATAAVAAARLGGTVSFWGRLGDDAEGRELRQELQSHGVRTPAPSVPGTQTPTAAVLVADHGERLLAVFRGQLDDSPDWLPLAEVAAVQAVLADFRWPRGARALYAAAQAQNIPRVLDADVGDPQGVHGLLPWVDHAIFSQAGLAQASGHGEMGPADIELALRRMRERCPGVVAVTLGEHGSVFLIDGVMHRVRAIRVDANDTNGAGDVFHGAYALALAQGLGVLDAARVASAAAALKCSNGTGWAAAPDRADVDQLLKETQW